MLNIWNDLGSYDIQDDMLLEVYFGEDVYQDHLAQEELVMD